MTVCSLNSQASLQVDARHTELEIDVDMSEPSGFILNL